MTDENNAPKENTGANVEKVETIKKRNNCCRLWYIIPRR